MRGSSSSNQERQYGAEQPPEYYDQTFRAADHWRHHYTESRYYPLWSVIADRILRTGVRSILDIGCGPGQVACLMRDKGLSRYRGIDFSPARVKQAKSVCPEFDFDVKDVFASDVFETADYDCVLLLEFLEHVEDDLQIFEKIKPGSLVLASVPNFPDPGHVRYFDSVDEVRVRYQKCFTAFSVAEHLASSSGRRFYLMEGRI